MMLALAVLTSVVAAGPVTPSTGAALLAHQPSIRHAVARLAFPSEGGLLTPPLRRSVRPTIVRYSLGRRLSAICLGMMAGMAVAAWTARAVSDMNDDDDDLQTFYTVVGLGAAGGGILGGVFRW